MTDHVARLYAGALALLAFFLVWAVIAARPWIGADEPDPQMQALQRRELALKDEAQRVNRVVERRFAAYRRRLARREREIAAAATAAPSAAPSAAAPPAAAPAQAPPAVSVTTAAPLTATGSS